MPRQIGDPNPTNPDEIVLFVAQADVPTEFTLDGETFTVFGECIIYGPAPEPTP